MNINRLRPQRTTRWEEAASRFAYPRSLDQGLGEAFGTLPRELQLHVRSYLPALSSEVIDYGIPMRRESLDVMVDTVHRAWPTDGDAFMVDTNEANGNRVKELLERNLPVNVSQRIELVEVEKRTGGVGVLIMPRKGVHFRMVTTQNDEKQEEWTRTQKLEIRNALHPVYSDAQLTPKYVWVFRYWSELPENQNVPVYEHYYDNPYSIGAQGGFTVYAPGGDPDDIQPFELP